MKFNPSFKMTGWAWIFLALILVAAATWAAPRYETYREAQRQEQRREQLDRYLEKIRKEEAEKNIGSPALDSRAWPNLKSPIDEGTSFESFKEQAEEMSDGELMVQGLYFSIVLGDCSEVASFAQAVLEARNRKDVEDFVGSDNEAFWRFVRATEKKFREEVARGICSLPQPPPPPLGFEKSI